MPEKIKVHPKADLFPMLSPEELQELAADIKENGLRSPIVLDKDGHLIDGRNRLAACEIAKVKPEFVTLNGHDPDAFIISQNLARRHMGPGARAMIVAQMFPEVAKGGGRSKTGRELDQFPMVNKNGLARARKVLRFAPDLVDSVLTGVASLESAYNTARDREQLAESDESKIALLRQEARDLADLVTEERMGLNEAVAALQERKRKTAEIIEHGKQAAETGLSRFLADVASIIAAVKTSGDKIVDKKKFAAVAKATEQLRSVV